MTVEAPSEGAGPENPGDLPPLGDPAPAPEGGGSWGLTFGAPGGTKTPVTIAGGGVLLHHEELNVALVRAREKFAQATIRAAQLKLPDLEVDPDEIIARLVEHSAAMATISLSSPPDAGLDRPRIANHMGGAALEPAAIDAQVAALAPGWPKRVGDHLFVADPHGDPEFLDSSTSLMSWMDEHAQVD
jgi:hypothetical protein